MNNYSTEFIQSLDLKLKVNDNDPEIREKYDGSLAVALRFYDDGRRTILFKDNDGEAFEMETSDMELKYITKMVNNEIR